MSAIRAELTRFKAVAAMFIGFFILVAIATEVIVASLARGTASQKHLQVWIQPSRQARTHDSWLSVVIVLSVVVEWLVYEDNIAQETFRKTCLAVGGLLAWHNFDSFMGNLALSRWLRRSV